MNRKIFELSVTANIILINLVSFFIFYIWMMADKNAINYIALRPDFVLQGRYLWTFVTSMFMHGGIWHLFANMFTLFFIGGLVERLIGKKRYLYFYLVSGIIAGLFFVLVSLVTGSNLQTYAVGASGAIFGLAGFLMLITPNIPVYIMLIPIPVKMKYAIPGILVLLWLISITPMFFGGQKIPIGNTAHLGGFLAGLFYGYHIRKKYPRKVRAISRYFS